MRHAAAMAIHRFFTDEGFVWVNTPIITASRRRGRGQMFRVSTLDLANPPRTSTASVDFHKDFFGKEAFLTVSGQLNVEAYCLALSKVYTFGPTFRAENSNTTRHLAEFWMIEPEIAFADLSADADLAERFLKAIFRAVLAERMDDLKFSSDRAQGGRHARALIDRLEKFVDSSFERIDLQRGDRDPQKRSKKKFEYRPSGAKTCRPSTSASSPRSTSAARWWS
jgi:asparaginyl-tRNA synthetase